MSLRSPLLIRGLFIYLRVMDEEDFTISFDSDDESWRAVYRLNRVSVGHGCK